MILHHRAPKHEWQPDHLINAHQCQPVPERVEKEPVPSDWGLLPGRSTSAANVDEDAVNVAKFISSAVWGICRVMKLGTFDICASLSFHNMHA